MAEKDKLLSILQSFDNDWSASQEAREEASNDLFFSRVSQWDDWLCQFTTLQYRGQFDVVRPVVRKLVAEMRANPIDVQYKPKDNSNPDSADTLMGLYRTDMRKNTAKIAVNVAVREQLEAGVGAWRLVTEHEDQDPTSNNQIIKRELIHEACTHVIWDANSKQIDKSDAKHVMVINPFSRDAWEEYAEENNIDESDCPDFKNPNNSWDFPWLTNDNVYVGEYYEVTEKKELVFIYQDPLSGQPVSYYKADIKNVIDELAEKGFIKIGERQIKRRRVYKYVVTSTAIIKGPDLIAGEHLPIVPVFGEWGFVGDKEVYEGVVRLTKDGQRLRNMVMSFGADIVGRSPKKKPIFWPEQIQGYEHMYGSDNEYAYYLMNRKDENTGADLPAQPIAYMDNAEIPQANAFMLEAATAAIKEVASSGVDDQAANGQVAFDTVNQLNQRSDLETYVFMDNLATAMRRDGEVYASMVNDIYDVPRNVTITLQDGSEKTVQIMSQVVDYRTGQVVVTNDIRGRYETYTDTGPSFQSMKQQSRQELKDLLAQVPPQTPVWNLLLLQYLSLLDGKGMDMIRDYANNQLVIMGVKKPETPEEQQALQQAQQAQANQPDPNMVAAQAQQQLAQAEMMKAQNQMQQVQVKAQDAQIRAFEAQQNAQESQSKTVLNLAQARDIDRDAVRKNVELLHNIAQDQLEHITKTARNSEPPQTM